MSADNLSCITNELKSAKILEHCAPIVSNQAEQMYICIEQIGMVVGRYRLLSVLLVHNSYQLIMMDWEGMLLILLTQIEFSDLKFSLIGFQFWVCIAFWETGSSC